MPDSFFAIITTGFIYLFYNQSHRLLEFSFVFMLNQGTSGLEVNISLRVISSMIFAQISQLFVFHFFNDEITSVASILFLII